MFNENPAQSTASQSLPLVIAGPILRRLESRQVCLWLVTSQPCQISLTLQQHNNKQRLFDSQLTAQQIQHYRVGEKAYVVHIDVTPTQELTANTRFDYDLNFIDAHGQQHSLADCVTNLCYPGCTQPNFRFQTRLSNVLHGSCRKPHHPGGDALLRVDQLIEQELQGGVMRPDMLHMTGDQVYMDDVAGPMLNAIQQTIAILGLCHEPLQGALINNSEALLDHPYSYYQREMLLPHNDATKGLIEKFIRAKRKPLFTSVNAQNHLIAFNEMLAMYLLVWSPALWSYIQLDEASVPSQYQSRFAAEKTVIEKFIAGLDRVRRMMAHIPVYMIFDDHDVTDDWNLTRDWEEAVYTHPFSKRVVGNALMSYWLCQGWGNDPKAFKPIQKQAKQTFTSTGLQQQDKLIEQLLQWQQWHYQLETQPLTIVLDSRTRRWRSETTPNKPSGLLDWEALCEWQQNMIDKEAVIVISPAPIFGVKMIEAVQKVFAFFGQALMVDAENWMSHKGAANVLLNIFTHNRTPPEFVILSGDVHYSFVYDVRLRFKSNSPHITQFTCSGFKNEFPPTLLRWLDKLNRLLYSSWSPLNWFTQRRQMHIKHRSPQASSGRTLVQCCAVGQLLLTDGQNNLSCKLLHANGQDIEFIKSH